MPSHGVVVRCQRVTLWDVPCSAWLFLDLCARCARVTVRAAVGGGGGLCTLALYPCKAALIYTNPPSGGRRPPRFTALGHGTGDRPATRLLRASHPFLSPRRPGGFAALCDVQRMSGSSVPSVCTCRGHRGVQASILNPTLTLQSHYTRYWLHARSHEHFTGMQKLIL
jgi:hypothetical protein